MLSTLQMPAIGVIVLGLASAIFVFVLAGYLRDLFSPPKPIGGQRWMIALVLLVAIPLWGGFVNAFLFEGLSDTLFGNTETRGYIIASFFIALSMLWLVVLLRFLFLAFQGARENPSNVFGGAAILILIAAGYAVADFFFDLPFLNFIDASKEAVR